MVVKKRVAGVVEHNDGNFSVVQTVGIEGPEKDLLLEEVQFHRQDTEDTPEEFQSRLPFGMWLDITTTTEITSAPECTIKKVPNLGHQGMSSEVHRGRPRMRRSLRRGRSRPSW